MEKIFFDYHRMTRVGKVRKMNYLIGPLEKNRRVYLNGDRNIVFVSEDTS